jgi:hypothetical protein
MKISTWLISLLLAFPAITQASIISIEYSGIITWSMPAARPSTDIFHYQEGDRITGSVKIDLSKGWDQLPEADRAEYRTKLGASGLVTSNFVPEYQSGQDDLVKVWDNVPVDGKSLDKLTVGDVVHYHVDLGYMDYERENYNFSINIILDNDWFSGDRLNPVNTEVAIPVLPGSGGSLFADRIVYIDQNVHAWWNDGIDFSVDSIKITQASVPEPAPLVPLLLGALLITLKRKNLRIDQ